MKEPPIIFRIRFCSVRSNLSPLERGKGVCYIALCIKPFRRFRKAATLHLLHESNHIPMFAAGITSERLFLRIDDQRRMMVVMERAKPFK